jgi:hypothetical protein
VIRKQNEILLKKIIKGKEINNNIGFGEKGTENVYTSN